MDYRKFSAGQIFNGNNFLDKDMVLITDENGLVMDLVTKEMAGDDVEILQGILSPGLINCHCHLELSHMKGVIPPHTGLIDFLISVITRRGEQNEEVILEKIAEAEKEMYENGMAGVADISNTSHTIKTKQKSSMHWHNLVEVLNFYDRNLPERLNFYQGILEDFKSLQSATDISEVAGCLNTSVLTPHAPYTISTTTYQAINRLTANQIISIHNQETQAENELFKTGTGDFLRLFAAVGITETPFAKSGKSSLQTYLPHFTNGQTIILVHNTFISEEDILFACQHAAMHHLKIVYCLCPNANLYIENTLPPVDLLLKNNCEIVLGTDSYSSNRQLNVAGEMATLLNHFPHLPVETVLKCSTGNCATALGWNNCGKFSKGVQPGMVLLETDEGNRLTGVSKRII
jgi:cytosine/adenosine deaminase-related metal-dependent hydrolase